MKSCPKCGFKNERDAVECQRCGIVFEKYEMIQRKKIEENEQEERLTKKATQQDTSEPSQKKYNTTSQQRHQKLVNPVIVVSIIVALVISFIGYNIYIKIEADKAEIEFSNFVTSVSGKMIKLAISSESVVDEINREWRDAIFSDYNKRDFNVAIMEVRRRRKYTISSIQKLSKDIAESIKKITPPAIMESEYRRLKELYLVFNKYANMAVDPSGSLRSYSRQNSELSSEIKSAIKELEMMK